MGLLSKLREPLFYKDQQGKELYYPWGGPPGEAFFVTEKQKVSIRIFRLSLIALLSLNFFSLIYFDSQNIINSISADYLAGIIFGLYPIAYFFGIRFLKGNSEFLVIPKEKRFSVKRKIIMLWPFLILLQIPALQSAFENRSLGFLILSILFVFLISKFFWKIHKTKGYFFSE
ncbi:MAG: hypothetical protein KAJ29_07240 [Alphaproteobacteria bacterium]|nr:hypothetical protein [Alphaproteobacteria bacterium]